MNARRSPAGVVIASAVGCAEAASSAPKLRKLRPTLLGSCSVLVVGLEAVAHLGRPGNSRPLAQSRVSPELEVGFQGQGTDWKKTGLPGSSRSHLPHGRYSVGAKKFCYNCPPCFDMSSLDTLFEIRYTGIRYIELRS